MNLDGFEKHRIELAKPLLLIRAKGGILACGYLNVATFNKTGEACAIVTGVNDFTDMVAAPIAAASEAAIALGVKLGEPGMAALGKLDC